MGLQVRKPFPGFACIDIACHLNWMERIPVIVAWVEPQFAQVRSRKMEGAVVGAADDRATQRRRWTRRVGQQLSRNVNKVAAGHDCGAKQMRNSSTAPGTNLATSSYQRNFFARSSGANPDAVQLKINHECCGSSGSNMCS